MINHNYEFFDAEEEDNKKFSKKNKNKNKNNSCDYNKKNNNKRINDYEFNFNIIKKQKKIIWPNGDINEVITNKNKKINGKDL